MAVPQGGELVTAFARLRIAVGLLVMLAAACRRPSDPVRAALDEAVHAAEKRNASAVAALLTDDFAAADGSNRQDLESLLRRTFAAYSKLSVETRALTVERGEGAALARFEAHLSGTPVQFGGLSALLPRESAYRLEVRLVPEGDRWKIAWASWTPLDQ